MQLNSNRVKILLLTMVQPIVQDVVTDWMRCI